MKKFAYPLQAFAALFICGGMAWMVFVLAGLNPTPPTVIDLQARNTQDLSFTNMNSTAVALAKDMIVNLMPTASGPILLPITGNGTSTPIPTGAMTLVAIGRSSETPTTFSLFSFLFQPTATREKPIREKPTIAPTLPPASPVPPSSTATLPATQTQPPSSTPLPPTRTPTDVPPSPTHTSVAPTNTTQPPTLTSVPPTATSVPPTNTSQPPPDTNTPEPVVTTEPPNTPVP